MPFYVYELSSFGTGETAAKNPHGVRLAGNAGPFWKHASTKFSAPANGVVTWALEEEQILRLLNKQADTSKRALVVDLMPADPKHVSLYRLRRVWGWTEKGWTPLALQLEELFVEKEVENVHAFKAEFQLPPPGQLIHEFLYLRGGYKSGTWLWGRNGSVNATLLWPRTFKWFVEQIAPYVPA